MQVKRLSIILGAALLLCASAFAGRVFIFDPATGRVLADLQSADSGSYLGASNAVVFYKTNASTIPLGADIRFLLVTNGTVIPMSASQSNQIVAAAAAAADGALRQTANAPLLALTPDGLILRALADSMIDEINTLRLQISQAKTNFSGFTNSATLAPRTLNQLRNAITNKVNN